MPNKVKVSVCITVKNEEPSIGQLLDSLLAQTKTPGEIIVCDGNSTDNTAKIVKQYKSVKLITSKKAGIAVGRNKAIEYANGEIIAMIDAGCVAKKDWVELITEPFRPTSRKASRDSSLTLVAGFYEMPYKTPLQQVLSVYHGVPPERYNRFHFLPSARSVAFNKTVWEKVGKFNERLKKAGEDSEFFYKCVKTGVKIIRVKEARVIWKEIESLTFAVSLKKFYSYAKGDAQTRIWFHPEKQQASHNIKISLIFLRYLAGLLILILCILNVVPYYSLYILISLYLIFPIYKWFSVIKSWQGRLMLPAVQITSDFAVMAGFLRGIIAK